MSEVDNAYATWLEDPNPRSMAAIIKALSPAVNSEIQQFSGPKQLLRQRAKLLTIKAVKNYDPTSKAKLKSWVVTNMQPLKRYNRELGNAVHVPEQAQQQAALLNRRVEEIKAETGEEPNDGQLADEIGISTDRVKNLRAMSKAVVYEGTVKTDAETNVSDLAVDSGRDGRIDAAVDTVYNSLDSRDQMIYDLKTGINAAPALDNQGVAKRLGVSPGLVSQRSADISNRILEARDRV
jgi:RNA polymerase primary sigma factor